MDTFGNEGTGGLLLDETKCRNYTMSLRDRGAHFDGNRMERLDPDRAFQSC